MKPNAIKHYDQIMIMAQVNLFFAHPKYLKYQAKKYPKPTQYAMQVLQVVNVDGNIEGCEWE